MYRTAYIQETGTSFNSRIDHVWKDVENELHRHGMGKFCRDNGQLTRIARQDKGCNYGASGVYDVTYTHPTMGDYFYTIRLSDG